MIYFEGYVVVGRYSSQQTMYKISFKHKNGDVDVAMGNTRQAALARMNMKVSSHDAPRRDYTLTYR
jgi:hypothetical protein